MELSEKLQELRKAKGLTQEELAEILYVSRTAISKWESGRGFPNLESLKDISNYFSVSIDELLSCDKLISLAEKENKTKINNICNILFATVDIFAFMLILLPLYPKPVNGYIYSVNLLSYEDITSFNYTLYWILILLLTLLGLIKMILSILKNEKGQKILIILSTLVSIVTIIYFALRKEPYAVSFLFIFFLSKIIILLEQTKNKR